MNLLYRTGVLSPGEKPFSSSLFPLPWIFRWQWVALAVCLAVCWSSSASAEAGPAKAAAGTSVVAKAAKMPASDEESEASEPEDVVTMCLSEHEKAQRLRQSGSLLDSRASARLCATSECPLAVRKDCYAWLDELSRQIPSVSFRVTVDGVSTINVKVTIDGRLMQTQLDGKALELDPGPHHVRLEVAGHEPHEEDVLLAEGDRFRVIDARFRANPMLPSSPMARVPSGVGPDLAEESGQPVVTYVFAGLGAAAAISGAAWGFSTWAGKGELEECKPNCKESSINVVKRRAILADVSWGVSAASLLTSVILYWVNDGPATSRDPVTVDVGALPEGGAVGSVGVSF